MQFYGVRMSELSKIVSNTATQVRRNASSALLKAGVRHAIDKEIISKLILSTTGMMSTAMIYGSVIGVPLGELLGRSFAELNLSPE